MFGLNFSKKDGVEAAVAEAVHEELSPWSGDITKIKLFSRFTDDEKAQLLTLDLDIRHYPEGSIILDEGVPSAAFYVILEGKAGVYKLGFGDRITFLLKDQVFGEIAFFTKRNTTTKVISEDRDTWVLRMDKHFMEKIDLEMRDKLKDKIIDKLATIVENLNFKMVNQQRLSR